MAQMSVYKLETHYSISEAGRRGLCCYPQLTESSAGNSAEVFSAARNPQRSWSDVAHRSFFQSVIRKGFGRPRRQGLCCLSTAAKASVGHGADVFVVTCNPHRRRSSMPQRSLAPLDIREGVGRTWRSCLCCHPQPQQASVEHAAEIFGAG